MSRLAAVTGAGRGIGAAVAERLAADGLDVALGDLDAGAARATAQRIGPRAAGFDLDVTDCASFAAFLAAAEARFDRPVDVLVNNAGVLWVGPFEDEPDAVARRQFAVNVHGVLHGMKLVLPAMRARGSGHVINVASAASRLAPAGEATYAATKHAVLGCSTSVRAELRGSGVEVSVVMPVVVDTELARGTDAGAVRLSPEQVAAAVARTVARPRFEVFVPGSIAAFARLQALLPQRARDAVHRRWVPDQVRGTDHAARAAYEKELTR